MFDSNWDPTQEYFALQRSSWSIATAARPWAASGRLSIDRPFLFAQIKGACYNSDHQIVTTPCFELSEEYQEYASIYLRLLAS